MSVKSSRSLVASTRPLEAGREGRGGRGGGGCVREQKQRAKKQEGGGRAGVGKKNGGGREGDEGGEKKTRSWARGPPTAARPRGQPSPARSPFQSCPARLSIPLPGRAKRGKGRAAAGGAGAADSKTGALRQRAWFFVPKCPPPPAAPPAPAPRSPLRQPSDTQKRAPGGQLAESGGWQGVTGLGRGVVAGRPALCSPLEAGAPQSRNANAPLPCQTGRVACSACTAGASGGRGGGERGPNERSTPNGPAPASSSLFWPRAPRYSPSKLTAERPGCRPCRTDQERG